jgi:predicted anti-sigma-YlaC factor YlaD
MKDIHITEILDGKRYAEISAEETASIAEHAAVCASCAAAFDAARISSYLLETRAEAASVEPSPFFQAKVMNAVRARQNLRKPMAAFRRWWQASYSMIALMIMTVAALIALTLFAPSSSADETQAVVPNNLYTTDGVIMNQRTPRDMSDEQVFQVIYNPRFEAGKNNGQR